MMCDYELGKFTFLDKIEPVIPPAVPQIIEIPEIIVESSDENPEIIEAKSDSEDCVEISQSEIFFEGAKRKNGFLIESPIKKLAISENANIQVCVTKHSDKQLSDKLQRMLKQSQSEPSSQTNSIETNTPTNTQTNTSEYKQYNDPMRLVTPGKGNPCKWFMCQIQMDFMNQENLFDHILGDHVEPCEGQEVFMCQWGGCKVFDVPSTSYSWFKGHVLAHTTAKKYRCLIEGCPAAFRTREGLSHHMEVQNNHFIIPSDSKKTNKNKNKHKPKPKSKSTTTSCLPVWRHHEDSFSPQRRSRRLHHTPSFKRYFAENDTEDESISSTFREFTPDPILLGIQHRAEVMTSSDLLQAIKRSSHESNLKLDLDSHINHLSPHTQYKHISFQVLGRRWLEDTESSFEYLCGISKTLTDWFTTDTLSTLFHTSLNLNTTEPNSIQSNLRMRTNKRK